MSKQNWILLTIVLGLIGITGAGLGWMKQHQRLGKPGVKSTPFPGDPIRVQVELPEHVLDYQSEVIEPDAIVTNTLPRDTSYGSRRYVAADKFQIVANVVLMGTDPLASINRNSASKARDGASIKAPLPKLKSTSRNLILTIFQW